jgi:hypothetical protein
VRHVDHDAVLREYIASRQRERNERQEQLAIYREMVAHSGASQGTWQACKVSPEWT